MTEVNVKLLAWLVASFVLQETNIIFDFIATNLLESFFKILKKTIHFFSYTKQFTVEQNESKFSHKFEVEIIIVCL